MAVHSQGRKSLPPARPPYGAHRTAAGRRACRLDPVTRARPAAALLRGPAALARLPGCHPCPAAGRRGSTRRRPAGAAARTARFNWGPAQPPATVPARPATPGPASPRQRARQRRQEPSAGLGPSASPPQAWGRRRPSQGAWPPAGPCCKREAGRSGEAAIVTGNGAEAQPRLLLYGWQHCQRRPMAHPKAHRPWCFHRVQARRPTPPEGLLSRILALWQDGGVAGYNWGGMRACPSAVAAPLRTACRRCLPIEFAHFAPPLPCIRCPCGRHSTSAILRPEPQQGPAPRPAAASTASGRRHTQPNSQAQASRLAEAHPEPACQPLRPPHAVWGLGLHL